MRAGCRVDRGVSVRLLAGGEAVRVVRGGVGFNVPDSWRGMSAYARMNYLRETFQWDKWRSARVIRTVRKAVTGRGVFWWEKV